MAGKHIAFLRAVNVGGRTVTMARLRELFEELGLEDVSTFINSGNVTYGAPHRKRPGTLERAVEAHLAAALGYEVPTFVRTDFELAEIAAVDLFDGRPGRVHVVFLKEPATSAQRRAVEGLGGERDELRVVGREVHWWTAGGLMDSDLQGDAIGKAMGKVVNTARNRNTVRKLAAKHPPP